MNGTATGPDRDRRLEDRPGRPHQCWVCGKSCLPHESMACTNCRDGRPRYWRAAPPVPIEKVRFEEEKYDRAAAIRAHLKTLPPPPRRDPVEVDPDPEPRVTLAPRGFIHSVVMARSAELKGAPAPNKPESTPNVWVPTPNIQVSQEEKDLLRLLTGEARREAGVDVGRFFALAKKDGFTVDEVKGFARGERRPTTAFLAFLAGVVGVDAKRLFAQFPSRT